MEKYTECPKNEGSKMKMNKTDLKVFVIVIALSIGVTNFAMQNDWVLVSRTGLKVPVSEKVLKLSRTFNDLLEDARGNKEIPTHFSNITLPFIVHLMQEQYRFGEGRSVPFQVRVNEEMSQLTDAQIIDIFKAANFLDLSIMLEGIAIVIVSRLPKNKIPDHIVNFWTTWSSRMQPEAKRAARDKIIKTPGFEFLSALDNNLFKYISGALSPAGVLVVNKTGYALLVTLDSGKQKVITGDDQLFLSMPDVISLQFLISFQSFNPQTYKAVSAVMDITGQNLVQEFNKLTKQPSQRNLIMTIAPDKGMTGLKDWFVNRVTWRAGVYGASMSRETETVTITPAVNQ
jgi:hypothetical protein